MKKKEPLIFARSVPERTGFSLPPVPDTATTSSVPDRFKRAEAPALPEVSEVDVMRHYHALSTYNYGVESGTYPLGSCTMKYNPKVNEDVCRLDGFAGGHPYAPADCVQGALELVYELERHLAAIVGLSGVSLQPAAGAHGEFTGIKVMRAWLRDQGDPRKRILIPDTAHGTNPASCTLNGYSVVNCASDERGVLSLAEVEAKMTDEVAGIMITNPNTVGLFEEEIEAVARIVHERGGLVYCDGANLNSIMGKVRPGDFGADIIHFNLHKTFSTPHGGGGPGSGPIAVREDLVQYLPVPRVVKGVDGFELVHQDPKSVGRVRSFLGNVGVMVRAYAYIRELGPEGLRRASELAVLNANYIRQALTGDFHLAYDRPCMHECVFSDKIQMRNGVKTMEIAKRLIDYGYHPMTVYFPLIVHGAMMIEPTETESLQELDDFIEAMRSIAREVEEHPETFPSYPTEAPVRLVDEVQAARKPVLTAP